MADATRQSELFYKRLRRVRFQQLALATLTAFFLTYGVLTLIVRMFADSPLIYLGLLVLPVLLYRVARQAGLQTPDRERLVAYLDLANRQQGLLMASVERPGQAESGQGWPEPVAKLPLVSWNRGRASLRFLAAGLFFVFCLAAPVSWVAESTSGLEIGAETAVIAEQIEILEETQVIDELESERLERALERLASEAEGNDPAKTWEALDHLERSMGEKAHSGAEQMEAAAADLERFRGLVDHLRQENPSFSQQQQRAALAELSQILQDKAMENAFLAMQLDPQQLKELFGDQLDATQLQELSALLQRASMQNGTQAAKLAQARLLKMSDFSALSRAQKSSLSLGKAELADFLDNIEAGGGQCKSLGNCLLPSGEVDRGRGDAEMTWTDGSAEQDSAFIPSVLPLGERSSLDQSKTVGLSAAAPEEAVGVTVTTDALAGAASGGGSAHTHQLLPRHRGAVKRYFDKQ